MIAETEDSPRVDQRSKVSRPLPTGLRWLCLVAGCTLLALLLLARYLEPSPSGLGTHRQLGFPACTTILLWGIPCPTCGMTTSWALVVRGELLAAARVNVGGFWVHVRVCGFLSGNRLGFGNSPYGGPPEPSS